MIFDIKIQDEFSDLTDNHFGKLKSRGGNSTLYTEKMLELEKCFVKYFVDVVIFTSEPHDYLNVYLTGMFG